MSALQRLGFAVLLDCWTVGHGFSKFFAKYAHFFSSRAHMYVYIGARVCARKE